MNPQTDLDIPEPKWGSRHPHTKMGIPESVWGLFSHYPEAVWGSFQFGTLGFCPKIGTAFKMGTPYRNGDPQIGMGRDMSIFQSGESP
jgi:hypothetical protein